MFIRKTKTSSSAKKYHYSYRLVETHRVADKVKQKTLLNLGAHFDLESVHWPELCQCIQSRLSPQSTLIDANFPNEIFSWAERLLVRLRPTEDTMAAESWTETVDLTINSVTKIAVLWLWSVWLFTQWNNWIYLNACLNYP